MIDVWDADSMHHLGSTSLDLSRLMHSGQPNMDSIMIDEHLDISVVELIDEAPNSLGKASVNSTKPAPHSFIPKSNMIGKLHLRMASLKRRETVELNSKIDSNKMYSLVLPNFRDGLSSRPESIRQGERVRNAIMNLLILFYFKNFFI